MLLCCVFLCCCVLCCCVLCCCVVLLLCCCCCVVCVWWVCSGPLRRTALRRTALRRTAQNFALFFFPLPPQFSLFSPLFWSFSLNFGGVFEDRDPQMCTFRFPGCRVKPARPHQTGPPGLAHDSPRTPNVHIWAPRRFKHHQNSTKKTKREWEKNENCGGRGKKKREILGPHPLGPHPSGPHRSGPHLSGPHASGPPLFLGSGPPQFGAPPFWAPMGETLNTKIGQSRFGQSRSTL